MTNHNVLDQVIDSLLAESGLLAPEDRVPKPATPATAPQEHWLRKTLKTGPVALPPPSRR